MDKVIITGNQLSIEDVVRVARFGAQVELSSAARAAINQARNWVESILVDDEPVYGINTGFGIFSDRKIPSSDAAKLSRNLMLSHAVATGDALPKEVVRAAMLVRINTLAKGFSGIRQEVVDTLIAMLNIDLVPVIPSQGSLGSSGDLAPLSHMALVFTTDENDFEHESGLAVYQGRQMSGRQAMQAAGLPRLVLQAKEGLAINNGATFSAALGALALYDSRHLLHTADISLAMTLEAILGCADAFDARLHQARGQIGQMLVAEHLLTLIKGSTMIDAAGRIQDAYSLRCAPQVQGIGWDTWQFVANIIEREINAATDNPLLFDGKAISGGNFHGEPVGVALDFLGIAMAEIAAISERRTFRLTDSRLNTGLPPMLVDTFEDAGLNSGMMMPQYTAASLVLENQTLASPDSVHSLPTSAEQEDHNANAMTAARHAREIIKNTCHVLAIEVYTAARALDIRQRINPGLMMGEGTQKAYDYVRKHVKYQAGDTWWQPEIEAVKALIDDASLLKAVGISD